MVNRALNAASVMPCGCSVSGCNRIRSTTLTTRTRNRGRCSRSNDVAASISTVGTSPAHTSTTSGSPPSSELVRRKFDLWYFGQARRPEAIAAVRKWSTYADVFVVRDAHRAAGYRAPCTRFGDPFQPRAVIWTYLGAAAPTLRNILALPEIDLDLPEYPVPPECAVPEAARRPMTLRVAR